MSSSRKRKVEVAVKEESAEAEGGEPSSKKSAKGKKSEGKSGGSMRKVVVKGRAPVDPEADGKLLTNTHVFSEGNDVYDVMLNQTNLQHNNNKFYLIQLLEDDNTKRYSVWQRWGRVGVRGQSNLVPCGPDLDQAKRLFCKKFHDKTKNDWADRRQFEKVAGKYDMLEIDYNSKEEEEKPKAKVKEEKPLEQAKPKPESKLDSRVQELIQLVCDVKAMEAAVMEMQYDAEKAPLGRLTKAQIKAGYLALQKVESCLNANDFGANLTQACNDFYTRIPHTFGMKRPPLIRDKQMLKAKLQLLEALGDIEITMKMLKEETDDNLNPIDQNYAALRCKLEPVEAEADEFKLVEEYVQNTHAPTHTQYRLRVKNLFNCAKDGEAERYTDVGNKMWLWHGSRMTNWCGILSQGLRIAPPEAPVTGYMFGKGVYFSDICSKSANYCFATQAKNLGLLALCEVSLGNTRDLKAADYQADKLPKGYNSTRGLGRMAPDESAKKILPDGCVVPVGKCQAVKIPEAKTYALNYNEFVIYDTKQVKIKYLVECEFDFK